MRSLLYILFVGFISNAQNANGEAYYVKKLNVKIETSKNDKSVNDMLSFVTNNMKKSLEKTYILTFTKEESTYKEEVKLESINSNLVSNSDNVSNLYKNIKSKLYYQTTELLGKIFLIKDSLHSYKWELKKETKKIGEYLCYKAVLKNDTEKSEVEVWYSLDIPISNGPEDLWGLPGLILEVKNDKIQLLCTKIVLNKDVKIKIPNRGEIVSKKEYSTIENEKLEEFKKNYNLKN